MDPERDPFPFAVPVIEDHEYDFPPTLHEGHAAALRVPCSEGPATYVFDRGLTSERALIEAESPIEPARQMEAGTEYDEETVRRLAPLFTPIRASAFELVETRASR